MWTVQIKDQTARSVQSDLNLHCPHKLLVSLSLKKELMPSTERVYYVHKDRRLSFVNHTEQNISLFLFIQL